MSERTFDREIFLLYFAHRHLSGAADEILAPFKMGRAHHRLMFFVGRKSGATVSEMLALLQVTNQSLYRVMNDLMQAGLLKQQLDPNDGRQRRLVLTRKGAALERRCAAAQAALFARAAATVGPNAAEAFSKMLGALMTAEESDLYLPLIDSRAVG